MKARLNFTCNHEWCLCWSVLVSLKLADGKDDFLSQVVDFVLNSERFMQTHGLDLSLIANANLEWSCDETYWRTTHTARDIVASFPSFALLAQLDQVFSLLCLERAPLEVQLREQLHLLQSVKLLKEIDLIRH